MATFGEQFPLSEPVHATKPEAEAGCSDALTPEDQRFVKNGRDH